jgi:hypothetical protein
MSAFTDASENVILDVMLRTGAALPAWWTALIVAPTNNIWAALFTSATTDAGGGTEVSGGAYTRMPVDFTPASGGASQNTVDVNFPVAGAAWGTITHVAIFDAVSAGQMLFHGPLAASKTIGMGDQFRFLASTLVVGLQ